eukprot:1159420-Pelagomonas_calceolata.AAC.10
MRVSKQSCLRQSNSSAIGRPPGDPTVVPPPIKEQCTRSNSSAIGRPPGDQKAECHRQSKSSARDQTAVPLADLLVIRKQSATARQCRQSNSSAAAQAFYFLSC